MKRILFVCLAVLLLLTACAPRSPRASLSQPAVDAPEDTAQATPPMLRRAGSVEGDTVCLIGTGAPYVDATGTVQYETILWTLDSNTARMDGVVLPQLSEGLAYAGQIYRIGNANYQIFEHYTTNVSTLCRLQADGTRTRVYEPETGWLVRNYAMDQVFTDGQGLYLVETPLTANQDFDFQKQKQLVRIDLATGERTVIYAADALWFASPIGCTVDGIVFASCGYDADAWDALETLQQQQHFVNAQFETNLNQTNLNQTAAYDLFCVAVDGTATPLMTITARYRPQVIPMADGSALVCWQDSEDYEIALLAGGQYCTMQRFAQCKEVYVTSTTPVDGRLPIEYGRPGEELQHAWLDVETGALEPIDKALIERINQHWSAMFTEHYAIAYAGGIYEEWNLDKSGNLVRVPEEQRGKAIAGIYGEHYALYSVQPIEDYWAGSQNWTPFTRVLQPAAPVGKP